MVSSVGHLQLSVEILWEIFRLAVDLFRLL